MYRRRATTASAATSSPSATSPASSSGPQGLHKDTVYPFFESGSLFLECCRICALCLVV